MHISLSKAVYIQYKAQFQQNYRPFDLASTCIKRNCLSLLFIGRYCQLNPNLFDMPVAYKKEYFWGISFRVKETYSGHFKE